MLTQAGTWKDGSMGVCRKHLVFFRWFAFLGEMMWFEVETAVVNVPAKSAWYIHDCTNGDLQRDVRWEIGLATLSFLTENVSHR